jgi:hypothetical protein
LILRAGITPASGAGFRIQKSLSQYKAAVRVAGEDVEASAMQWHLDRHLKDGSVVLFVPVVEGAITAAAAAWIAVAVSVASVAYSVYMSRNMKTKTSAEAAETNTLTNNSFTSAENRVGQARGATPTGRNGGRFERNHSVSTQVTTRTGQNQLAKVALCLQAAVKHQPQTPRR